MRLERYLAVAAAAAAAAFMVTISSGAALADGCPPDQIYDEGQGACISAEVTEGPSVGTDYDGAICNPTTFFDAPEDSCASDVITNDPKAPVPMEGEDPTQLSVPTVSKSPGCAAQQSGGCE